MKNLSDELTDRKSNNLYRTRKITDGPQQPAMVVDGKSVISFCSNDYLGLANHPEVKQAFIKGIEQYGVGSGAAHLINGHSKAHHALEEQLAEFTGYPRALLFSTGYMANLGAVSALTNKNDFIFEDKLNHASLIDAGLSSNATFKRYLHKNTADLEKKMTADKGEKLVITDGVFSMDGTMADVSELTQLCQSYDAWLMVDDAHGFGVLGNSGKGTLEHQAIEPQNVQLYMATLGKAMGTAGAFIAASEEIIETLIQKSRTYIYTTAMPAALAVATMASLKILKQQPEIRTQLHANIKHFKDNCNQLGIPVSESATAIQPVIIGTNKATLELSDALLQDNILVAAIRTPTVPKGTARLRVTLSASHTKTQIDRLTEVLAKNLKKTGKT